MANITVTMADTSTRTYDGRVDILEGGVLKITPDDEQYPIAFISAQIWLEAKQDQRESATP
jgi:hypothetical protein